MWTVGGSAYIQARMMGTSTKVSLHKGRESQWSMTSEWYAANRPNSPNRGRHIVKWQRAEPGPNAAAHVFRVIVPETELRLIDQTERLAKVVWLPAPSRDHSLNVECYVTPPVDESTFRVPFQHLASLPLGDGRWFVVLVHEFPMEDENKRQLAMLKVAAVSATGGALRIGFRGVGFLQDPTGVRGMVEFVPLVDGEAA